MTVKEKGLIVLLVCVVSTAIYFAERSEAKLKETYKYKVITDNGGYYTNNEVQDGCIKLENGMFCGTFRIKNLKD